MIADGARGLGVSLGSFNVNAGGTTFSVDLSTAHTVDDVVTMTQNDQVTVPVLANGVVPPAARAPGRRVAATEGDRDHAPS